MRHLIGSALALLACAALTPAAAAEDGCPTEFSGGKILQPGELVTARNFPLDMLDVHYAVLTSPAGEVHLLRGRVEAGQPSFMMTWAADTPWQGGEAKIALTDGLKICPDVSVQIGPLQPADGAFDYLVASLRERVTQRAELFDVDFETLADPAFKTDVPALRILHTLSLHIDGKGNPESLSSLLDSLRSDADTDARDAVSILEALFVASGSLDQMLDGIEQDPFFSGPPANRPRFGPQPAQWSGDRPKPSNAPLRATFQPFKSAKALSDAMTEQLDSESANKPHVQIYRDGAGALLAGGSALGKAAGPAGQKVALAYGIASQGLFIWGMIDKLQEGLYPNELRNLTIDAYPATIFLAEDPREGVITAVNVTPAAKGIDLGKLVLDVALQYAPVGDLINYRQNSVYKYSRGRDAKTVEAYARKLKNAENRRRNLKVDRLPSWFSPADARRIMNKRVDSARMWSEASEATFQRRLTRNEFFDGVLAIPVDMTKPLYLSQIINGLPDLEKIPPFEYPPVNILEKGYVQLNASRAGVIDIDFNSTGTIPYSAIEAGIVTVYAITAPGKFGNAQAKGDTVISVRDTWGLSITPPASTILPGDEANLFVVWEGPEDQVLNFNVDLDTDQIIHRFELAKAPIDMPDGRLGYPLLVRTVPQLDRFPINLTASLRSDPSKKAFAIINAPQITPNPVCLEPGSETNFKVVGEGSAPLPGWTWKVRSGPGRISADGNYVAPDKSPRNQSVTIEASLENSAPLVLSVETRLNCGCSWTLEALGQSWTGDDVTVMRMREPGKPEAHLVTVNDVEFASAIIAADGPLTPGRVSASLIATARERALAATDCTENDECVGKSPPIPPASYNINSVGPDYVEGIFSGTAVDTSVLPSDGDYATTHVLFRFRAGRTDAARAQDPATEELMAMARSMAGNDPEALAQLNTMEGMLGPNACAAAP